MVGVAVGKALTSQLKPPALANASFSSLPSVVPTSFVTLVLANLAWWDRRMSCTGQRDQLVPAARCAVRLKVSHGGADIKVASLFQSGCQCNEPSWRGRSEEPFEQIAPSESGGQTPAAGAAAARSPLVRFAQSGGNQRPQLATFFSAVIQMPQSSSYIMRGKAEDSARAADR